jgi:hypothetical protein
MVVAMVTCALNGKANMGKKNGNMTKKAAARIQSHADRSGKNQGFKQRAQRAAAKTSGSSSKSKK